jgi:GAF domain-containing protein/DNA-binding CsgD family transcriptional regulator
VQESVWRKLTEAGLAMHSDLSLGVVLRTLVDRASSVTDARWSVVGVLDRSGADFEHSVGRAELLGRLPHGAGRAMLDVPIVIRGVPFARLVVAEKRDRETFTSEDGEALSLLADQAAVAIENARRYESATRQLAEVEALGEVADALVGELDLSRLLVGVTERLRELLDARAVFAFLPTAEGDDLEVRATAGERARQHLGSRIPRDGSKAGRVFDRARGERVDVLIEDVDVYQPLAGQMNARAALFVPVLGDQGAVGVIAALNKRGADDTFSADDQRLAEAFAARVDVAIRLAAGGGQEGTHTPVEDHSGAASAGLTSREIEVLRLVAHGMSDAQVADKLVVSLRTVHAHLRSIYRKLQVGSRNEAARWAVERRLV